MKHVSSFRYGRQVKDRPQKLLTCMPTSTSLDHILTLSRHRCAAGKKFTSCFLSSVSCFLVWCWDVSPQTDGVHDTCPHDQLPSGTFHSQAVVYLFIFFQGQVWVLSPCFNSYAEGCRWTVRPPDAGLYSGGYLAAWHEDIRHSHCKNTQTQQSLGPKQITLFFGWFVLKRSGWINRNVQEMYLELQQS